jgi:hypothetical protein
MRKIVYDSEDLCVAVYSSMRDTEWAHGPEGYCLYTLFARVTVFEKHGNEPITWEKKIYPWDLVFKKGWLWRRRVVKTLTPAAQLMQAVNDAIAVVECHRQQVDNSLADIQPIISAWKEIGQLQSHAAAELNASH